MPKNLHSLLRDVGLEIPPALVDAEIFAVTCDSRTVRRGSLFLGLPGEKVDGGEFWPEALSAGAAAAVIGPSAAKLHAPQDEDPVIVVSSSIEHWIGELSAAFWNKPSLQMSLIGVTGTNGKTTTTYLIEHLSKAAGCQSALFGTLVNRWASQSIVASHTTSFPDKLQEHLAKAVLAGSTLGAMEVSSHALAQKRIAGCRFANAVFTNLTQDHLDYHHSIEAYFEAKALLFAPPFLDSAKANVVVNIDNEWGAQLAKRLGTNCWKCSLNPENIQLKSPELFVTEVEFTSLGLKGRLHSPAGNGTFISSLIGSFNLMNLLQAVGVLIQQGLPLEKLLAGISDFPGVPGRMECVQPFSLVEASLLPRVLVDYAHTPDGLKNALLALRPFTNGKLICVFGCGGDRDRGKRPQMASVAANHSDWMIVTSDNPRTEKPQQIFNDVAKGLPDDAEVIIEPDRSLAIHTAVSMAASDDVVLIAGKGHENYQIIGSDKIYFDDREEAKKAIRLKLNSLKSESN